MAAAAAAMGITMIEKHFIIDRKIGGPDASFSMEPKDFTEMVEAVRRVETLLGTVDYERNAESQGRSFGRSLFVVEDVKAGDELSSTNVKSIRPIDGLAPKYLKDVTGKRFAQDIRRGTPLSWEQIEK